MAFEHRVSIGDLEFLDPPGEVRDENGCEWTLSELTGWLDGPPVRGAAVDRENQDGQIDGPVFFGPRTITISGSTWAPDTAARGLAQERIRGLLAGSVRRGLILVEQAPLGLTRQATVRLGGATLIKRIGKRAFSWSLNLYSPESTIVGAVLRTATAKRFSNSGGFTFPLTFPLTFGAGGSSGLAYINNQGNASAWPVFRIAGPITNPVIRLAGGAEIGVYITLTAGQELVIDSATHRVTLDGMNRASQLSLGSEFFSLAAGVSQVYFSADDGTGTLTVEWRDTWV